VESSELAEIPGAFGEVAEAAGLDFVHFNGMTGQRYIVEVMGSGSALFDFDNDGDLDAYLVQGAILGPGKTLADAEFPPKGASPPKDRLFRNDLEVRADGSRRFAFVDVTEASGIDAQGVGFGAAAADYDNDGWIDLYVTEFDGPNQLWRNKGDGTFEEVGAAAGVQDGRWSTSAAWVDIDQDGWLDLFVCNYLDYKLDPPPHKCVQPAGWEDYCGPMFFSGVPDSLFRNRGDGTFDDISDSSLVSTIPGSGLGVVCADYDQDGLVDIYVANDARANFLWMNKGGGVFSNMSVLLGCALNADGRPEGSMGVDAGDFDNDGDDDLYMTHMFIEKNTLYLNDGGAFEDVSMAYGLARPSQPFTAFGTGWIDYDNNAWLDLFVANGDVRLIPELRAAGDPYPLHYRNQLMRNLSGKKFSDESRTGGDAFKLSEVSRGAAFGDIDNDGDTDILVTNNNGRARLMMNLVGAEQPWIGLRLVAKEGRDAIGARLEIRRRDAEPLWRRAHQDGSYLNSLDPRVLVGLGNYPEVEELIVTWPDGQIEAWRGEALPAINAYAALSQGSGEAFAAGE
jgi:hypothetical protein